MNSIPGGYEQFNEFLEQALLNRLIFHPSLILNFIMPNDFDLKYYICSYRWNEHFTPPNVPLLREAEEVDDDPLDLITAREPGDMDELTDDVIRASDIYSTAQELTDDEDLAIEHDKDENGSKRKKMNRFFKRIWKKIKPSTCKP